MTLTLTDIAGSGAWRSDDANASPANPDAWHVWPVRLTDEAGAQHTLDVPRAQGDPAPAWQSVADYLDTLPDGHDLADARLARWLTQRQYLALITDEELLDITDASEGRGGFGREQRKVARRAVEMTRSGDDIDLAARETRFLVLQLERKGLLSGGRAAEILAGERPA